MAIETNLTSVILNPWNTSHTPFTNTDQIQISYSSLGFVASASDSYKSTAGDIFKVFVDGTRIYRTDDSLYAGGTNFLEPGDSNNSILNGVSSSTWSGSTSNLVWVIDVTNQKIILDTGAILATSLYGNGGGAAVTFSSGTTIIEVRREVQDQSSPSVDFSNASILTEQDLDNSSSNVFHMAQQAIETANKALPYDTGTATFQAYQPGTTTKRKITQVADGTANNDAVNKAQLTATEVATLAYKEDTEDYKLEANDWANKSNGQVKAYTDNSPTGSDLGHSAKAHASVVGTHAPSTGSAKEWAQTVDVAIDTTFSAKEYAQGDANSDALSTGGSAKGWAQDTAKVNGATTNDRSAKSWAQGASMTGSTLGGSAKDWAQLAEDSQVNGSEYSAKHYSAKSAASATLASASEVSARNSAASVANIYDNFSDLYLGTMADNATADSGSLTGASWAKDSSSIAFTGTTGTISLGQELTTTATGYPLGANIIGSSVSTPLTISAPFTVAGSGVTLNFVGSGVYGAFNASKDGPALNNDGDALVAGNLYFNTTDNNMRVYDGTNWITATSTGTASMSEFKFVTTSGQVSSKTYSGTADVGGSLSYMAQNILVFLNGVLLKDTTDYTATNGTSVVLVVAPALNDELTVVAFKSFQVADTVSSSLGGTFSANVVFNGNIETSTSKKVIQRGAFMQSSTHQAMILGR